MFSFISASVLCWIIQSRSRYVFSLAWHSQAVNVQPIPGVSFSSLNLISSLAACIEKCTETRCFRMGCQESSLVCPKWLAWMDFLLFLLCLNWSILWSSVFVFSFVQNFLDQLLIPQRPYVWHCASMVSVQHTLSKVMASRPALHKEFKNCFAQVSHSMLLLGAGKWKGEAKAS